MKRLDSLLNENLLELGTVLRSIGIEEREIFSHIQTEVVQRLEAGGKIFWCGNGGSAAESSHMAAELLGRFKTNRKSLPSINLTADNSVVTCIANDFGYENIYSRQLEGLGNNNDVLVVFSTSGESLNTLNAIETANKLGILSISFLGKSGGKAKDISSLSLVVKSNTTARIQEIHQLLGQTLCEAIEIGLGIV